MADVRRYRKKPVEISAVQWFSDRGAYAATDPVVWLDFNGGKYRIDPADGKLYIVTLEGEMLVENGDFIIQGVKGEFYPCKPDIFALTYEEVTYN